MPGKYQPPKEWFDEVEGHGFVWRANAETAEGDTEGHGMRGSADAEGAEGDDDVEGHMPFKFWADSESAEGDDDVEGHGRKQS